MPVVTFDYHDFLQLLGHHIEKQTLIDKLPMIGADFDRIEGDEISIEFFPNRPDLTSVEGIARAARAFFGFHPGLTSYPTKSSEVTLRVDPSVKKVRPHVVTALIKQVTMTDALIKSLMDLQEKLHAGLGRNREKVAIGVHNFEPVVPPFTYKAVDPDAVQFIPLQKNESMTLQEILTQHEKGIEYAAILQDHEQYPLIVDVHNNVLSFPPIINGTLTEVTPYTSEIFIDVTGTDHHAIQYALNIVTTALAERGGQLYTTTVIDTDKSFLSPNLQPQEKTLSIPQVNKILGTTLKPPEIRTCLGKMGYQCTTLNDTKLSISIPAWRSDILHEIDLIEDVAVGYGYDQFTPDFPTQLTYGKKLPNYSLIQSLRYTLIGLGFTEVTTFTISNPHDEFIKLGQQPAEMVTIENPIGEEYSGIRVSLLASLLKILRENRHHALPQQIFEVGPIVDGKAKNRLRAAAVKIDEKANFTECKAYVETVFRNLGCTHNIVEYEHPAFIKGRCAAVQLQKQCIGYFGEVHPQTIQAFKLEHPIIGFEVLAEKLV